MAKKKSKPKGINIDIDPDKFQKMCEDNADGVLELYKIQGDKLSAAFGEPEHAAEMMVMFLLEEEEGLIRFEWAAKRGELAFSLDKQRERYVKARREVKEALGDRFDRIYAKVKTEENACARANLDSSDGKMFSFVLPDIKDDGTHGELGPKDTPWNIPIRKK
jgi:hypothetical protein